MVAFDNNEPGAFSASDSLFFCGNHGESPLIKEDGIIDRPYFDADFAAKICNLEKNEVFNRLGKHITKKQICRVWQRVTLLKGSIEKTVKVRPKFLLDEGQWSDETIKEECSGKYGNTYLCSIIK